MTTWDSKDGKSFSGNTENKVLQYTLSSTTPVHPVQQELLKETIATYTEEYKGANVIEGTLIGAPECLAVNTGIIRSKNAKKILDIGVFTGASALNSALAFSDKSDPNCQVIACEVTNKYEEITRRHWKKAGVDDKIQLIIAPAAETLERLIKDNQAGTFDFAFIDANKTSYDTYYEKCLILLKQGGVMCFDNTLWSGRVLADSGDTTQDTEALRKFNRKLPNDVNRVHVVQLNVGDGYTMAVKL